MSAHRAEQIIDAAVAAITAQVGPQGIKVYAHRRLSLAADQDELPAISVDFGEDEAAGETDTNLYSILTVEIAGIAVDYDESDLKALLLRLRREIHIALTEDETLGLAFVKAGTRAFYAGAAAPEYAETGEQLLGVLTSAWTFTYEMNRTDPGDN